MRIFSVFSGLLVSLIILTSLSFAEAQEIVKESSAGIGVDKLLDLLKRRDVITEEEAAGLRAELAIKEQEEKEGRKYFNVIAGKPIWISGYTQLRYQHFEEDGKNDSFDIRRLRLDIKGDITKSLDYRTQVDFGGSKGPFLLDAMIGYTFNPHLKITGGQFKVPFSQENLISSPKLETINRSQVVEALVARGKDVIGNQNGRDIGVMASGNFLQRGTRYLFDYAVGIFDGAGINTGDNNEKKDFVGRVVFHPIKNLDIGANYYNGMANLNKEDQNRDRIGADFHLYI